MKKTLLFTLITVLCLSSVFVAAKQKLVVDDADLLSDYQEQELERMIEDHECGADIVVVTALDTNGKTPMEYADDFYDENEYSEDGILFLISMAERDWYISTSGKCQYIFSDNDIQNIGEDVRHYLSNGEYYTAFVKFTVLAQDEIENYDGGGYIIPQDDVKESFGFVKWAGISLALGFIVALISVSVMKGKLKTVKHNALAQNYASDSFELQQCSDLFLYRHVSRTLRQTDTGSSGGSHTHMSSSGHSHGGGGGKF